MIRSYLGRIQYHKWHNLSNDAIAMNQEKRIQLQNAYAANLRNYVESHSEQHLFEISKLSKELLGEEIGPEEITEIHSAALTSVVSNQSAEEAVKTFQRAVDPLLEVMMNYAMTYRGYLQEHTKRINELENSIQSVESEKLASIGMLSLGMMNNAGNQLENIATYAKMLNQGGDIVKISNVIMKQAIETMSVVKAVYLYSKRLSKDQIKSVNINDLVQESIRIVSNATSLDSVIIETNLKHTVSLNMNAAQIQQALVNLLACIIDRINGNGKIIVETGLHVIRKREHISITFTFYSEPAKKQNIFSLPTSREDVALGKDCMEIQIFHERGPRYITPEDITNFLVQEINKSSSRIKLKIVEA